MNKKAQVTIFIIIGIIIVAGVISFIVFRGNLFQTKIPANMEPVYTTFLSCIEEDTLTGISVLESQAGYIFLPDFEPGSSHMPFSSQLDFLGNPIPYWYYVSGNNIEAEQVPSKSEMQKQLAEFVEGKLKDCVFEKYYEQGFEISLGEPNAEVLINDDVVRVDLSLSLEISKEEDNVKIKNHKVEVNSKLGKLYESAKKIYDYEQDNLFLEKYAVDTLRLYAPVTGVEISCSPQTWIIEDIFNNLQDAIEANTLALRKKGDFVKDKESEYFEVDVPVEEDVKFINSKSWSYSFEVANDESILIANPVGNQQGLGILGFCYVPYHFVYNVKYPVLIQVSEGDEIFQFPMAVIIQANNPRKSLDVDAIGVESPELCKRKNTLTKVNVYGSFLEDIDADISFECLGAKCNIGEANDGSLEAEFPQCVNGNVLAKAEGYVEGKTQYSTIESGTVDVILDRLYELDVDLSLEGINYNGEAIIYFNSESNSRTVVYPEERSVKLAQGQYEVSVHIHESSGLEFQGSIQEQCYDAPRSGVLGILGLTERKCVDIEIPDQIISNVLVGGGNQNYYVLESELANSNNLEINAERLKTPKTLEELQDNYLLFESSKLDINLR